MMKPKDSVPLNMKLDAKLLPKIVAYQHRRRFPTKTAAIEHLLRAGLKLDPPKDDAKQSE